jgi:hypothetical protein
VQIYERFKKGTEKWTLTGAEGEVFPLSSEYYFVDF